MTATFYPSRDFVRVPVSARATSSPAARFAPTRSSGTTGSTTVGAAAEANYLLRRVVAVVVAISVLAAGAVAVGEIVGAVSDLGGRPAAASEVTGADAAPAMHVAGSGDTLWSIADRYRGDVAHARYVDALVTLNGGTDIQVGQAVRLP